MPSTQLIAPCVAKRSRLGRQFPGGLGGGDGGESNYFAGSFRSLREGVHVLVEREGGRFCPFLSTSVDLGVSVLLSLLLSTLVLV